MSSPRMVRSRYKDGKTLTLTIVSAEPCAEFEARLAELLGMDRLYLTMDALADEHGEGAGDAGDDSTFRT